MLRCRLTDDMSVGVWSGAWLGCRYWEWVRCECDCLVLRHMCTVASLSCTTVVPQLSCINHARVCVCVYDVVAHVFLINTCAYVIMIDVIRACLGR